MSLTPSKAASAIWIAYQDIAGLDSNGDPTNAKPQRDFAADWADAYDAYAADGVVPGAINSGGDKSLLEAFFGGVVSDPSTVTIFAQALANYWSTVAVIPGAPAHGGSGVVSVSNDADSKVNLFYDAIRASMTSNRTEPFFLHLIENVQSIAVSEVVWTVVETVPNVGPVPFPESIV